MQGPCPGCEKTIVGMMPQRCFFCGYDFTESIKAQNESFEPDPNYKVPSDGLPTEEEVYRELKNRDRYGPSPEEAAVEATLSAIDRQKKLGEEIQKQAQTVAEAYVFSDNGGLPVEQFLYTLSRQFPAAEVEVWKDGLDSGVIRARLTFPIDKVIVEVSRVDDAPFRP